jgi:hypothetical protein
MKEFILYEKIQNSVIARWQYFAKQKIAYEAIY